MNWRRLLALCTGLLVVVCLPSASPAECPICGQPTVTLSERYARADVALLVEWVSTRPASEKKSDSTTYVIVQAPRGGERAFKPGRRLTIDGYHAGKPGSLVFLMGNENEAGKVQWDHPPLDVTETSFQYIIQAPSGELPTVKRLEYFVRFLEYPDYTIANDAFGEFVNASAADIAAMAGKLPREKIRRWLLDPRISPGRQAGYGLMLGLCGKPEDAGLLEERILDENEERRTGIEGLMVGLMLLKGEPALELLDRSFASKSDSSDGDVFSVITAIRYFWTYGNGSIARPRMVAVMRRFLRDPRVNESAIVDLARWKAWEIQEELRHLYVETDRADEKTRSAIIGYMLAATKDIPQNPDQELPPHAQLAHQALAEFRARDPKLVAKVESGFPSS
ncbi:MAG: hypothetical protein ACKV0T_10360 [Planctomycetales bacterium]